MVSGPELPSMRSFPGVPVTVPAPLTMFDRFNPIQALGLTLFAVTEMDRVPTLDDGITMPAEKAVNMLVMTSITRLKPTSFMRVVKIKILFSLRTLSDRIRQSQHCCDMCYFHNFVVLSSLVAYPQGYKSVNLHSNFEDPDKAVGYL